jgi:protein gp37
MGATTGVSWTGATWNPWHGCSKVSPGCTFCYMYRDKRRYGQDPMKVVRSKDATFYVPFKWQREAEQEKRVGQDCLIFTCSWSDFFLADADAWRPEAWAIMRQTPSLNYQVLSKRPERMRQHLPDDWGEGYPNVILGVSVETRQYLTRLQILSEIPATRRFASLEPLLEDLGDLSPWLPHLSQVILGGESGPKRRPMDLGWMTKVATQCQAAGIPTWIKQDSALRDGQQGRIPEYLWRLKQFPASV